MTTMNDIVTGALRRLRVVNPRKNVDGVTASEAMTALNDMLHSYKSVGVDLDYESLTLTDEFPLDEQFVQGVKALLAVRLASDYGLDINPGITRDAAQGWTALQAEFADSPAKPDFFSDGLRSTLRRWMQ